MKVSDTGGGDFQQAPAGTHIGRCVRIIDLGTQFGEYQGKPTSARKVVVSWELPNALMTEGNFAGQPFIVGKWYTASIGEKANLRKDLVNWRGREFTDEELQGFDIKKLLGVPCMLSLTPNDKNKVRVTGIMKPPAGTTCPPQINPNLYFSLERDEFSQATFDGLQEFWQTEIKKSPEWQDIQGKGGPIKTGTSGLAEMEDDIPF
jgi:hypothetical protein